MQMKFSLEGPLQYEEAFGYIYTALPFFGDRHNKPLFGQYDSHGILIIHSAEFSHPDALNDMAKGRKLTISRSERYLGSSYSYGNSYGGDQSDVAEFAEEDVWSIDDRSSNDVDDSSRNWNPSAGAVTITRTGAPQRGDGHAGGLSQAFDNSSAPMAAPSRIVHQFRGNDAAAGSPRGGRHNMASSAPVNVPDWSKIYRANSVESMHDSDDGLPERDWEMVPPHVYLAHQYARSRQMIGISVCEGQGRTLKGRDLSRVRDAVWSQTGFDG